LGGVSLCPQLTDCCAEFWDVFAAMFLIIFGSSQELYLCHALLIVELFAQDYRVVGFCLLLFADFTGLCT